MFERTEVIATFASEADAQVARVRLLLNGIEACVTGDVPSLANSLIGRLPCAPIELSVPTSQVPWARFFLDVAGLEVLEPDWEALAELAVDGWICRCCDSEIDGGEDECSACGTHRWHVESDD